MPLPFKLAKEPTEKELRADLEKLKKELSEFNELLKKNKKSADRYGELETGRDIVGSQLHIATTALRKIDKGKGGRRTYRRRRVSRTRRR